MSRCATDCGPKALGPPSPLAAKLPLAPRLDCLEKYQTNLQPCLSPEKPLDSKNLQESEA